jgi:hypothetical protein
VSIDLGIGDVGEGWCTRGQGGGMLRLERGMMIGRLEGVRLRASMSCSWYLKMKVLGTRNRLGIWGPRHGLDGSLTRKYAIEHMQMIAKREEAASSVAAPSKSPCAIGNGRTVSKLGWPM